MYRNWGGREKSIAKILLGLCTLLQLWLISSKDCNLKKSNNEYLLSYWIQRWHIVNSYHSSDPPLFKGGEVNFKYLCRRGGIWKIKKREWKYGAGASLLKRGSWHFSYLIFSRFIIFAIRNYFTLCKIVLYIWRRMIFFCHHNFMKKGHSKLSKNEPEDIPYKLREPICKGI